MTTKINRSPGRPRSFDVDQALETAIALFQERGYDSVGVAELVEVLGIKPPSFYSAFGSKAGLLEQAMARYNASANVFDLARAEGGSTIDVLDRMLMIAANNYAGCNGATGCLVLDGTRNSDDPAARAIAARMKQASFDAIRDFVARDYPERADELARLVTVALSGMSAAARDGATEAELTSFASVVSEGLRKRVEAP